jgi:hypothetical protein
LSELHNNKICSSLLAVSTIAIPIKPQAGDKDSFFRSV